MSRFESPVNRVPVDDVPPSHGSVLSLNEPPTNPVRFNDVGLAYIAEDRAAPHLERCFLPRVLDARCQPFPGFFLYYPSRRRQPAALPALIDTSPLEQNRRK